MTIVATTSPSFGLYGRVSERLQARRWELIRCVDSSLPDGGLSAHLDRVEYLVVGLVAVDGKTLDAAPRLKAVLKHGVGVDNIDIPACTARGIPVLNTPAANSNAVAELAIGTIFGLSRNLVGLHNSLLAGQWNRPVGGEVEGKTLGIVGLGNIGRILAVKAAALGMKVLASDLRPDYDFARQHGIEIVELDALLERCNFVSLHVFGGGEPLITRERLALMRKDACLLNMARGDVVDLDALDVALRDGKLAGAALDAFAAEPPDLSHQIFAHQNVIFTPHIGASTIESVERVGLMNIDDIEELLRGGRPQRTLNTEVYGQ